MRLCNTWLHCLVDTEWSAAFHLLPAVSKKSPFTVPGYFAQTEDIAAKQRQQSWLKKFSGKNPLFCISGVRLTIIIDNTMVIEYGFLTHWLVYKKIYFVTDMPSY